MKLLKVSQQEHKQIQLLELKILEEFDRICKKHQLKYTIAYGTLLGAVRHHGFIPWDDDIDVCMPRNDFEQLRQVYRNDLGKDYFYQCNATDPEYFYLMDKIRLNGTVFKESFVSKYAIHHGIYIDIFPIDKIPNTNFKKNIQYFAFHFFRTGLQAKFLMSSARTGLKKIAALILKCLYVFFSKPFLYKQAHKIASMYNDVNCREITCFFSPYKKKDVYNIEMMQVIEYRQFESIKVASVAKYDEMLSLLYGDYMKLPPLKDRETKHTVTELVL